jgi:hypothetical protein
MRPTSGRICGKQPDPAQGPARFGFQLGTDEPQSAIISVIMPDLERGAMMWEALLHEGLYVNLARPPATPANMTLLRCSLCALHTADQVQTIIGMFQRAGKTAGISDPSALGKKKAPVSRSETGAFLRSGWLGNAGHRGVGAGVDRPALVSAQHGRGKNRPRPAAKAATA